MRILNTIMLEQSRSLSKHCCRDFRCRRYRSYIQCCHTKKQAAEVMLRRCKLYAGDPNPRCVPDGWSPLPSGMISMLQGRLESVLFWCYNSGALSSRLLLWISCDDCSCKGWNVEHHILTFLWGLDPLGSNPVSFLTKRTWSTCSTQRITA